MNSTSESKSLCRKCLLRDMNSQKKLFKSIEAYIDRIEPELKVEKSMYEKRLAECKNCDLLVNGMCSFCGCYVELKAVMKKNSCPIPQSRWASLIKG